LLDALRADQSSSDDELEEPFELELDEELELEFELELLDELDELLELELFEEFDERLELELFDELLFEFGQLELPDLPPEMTVLKNFEMSSSAWAVVCAVGAASSIAPRMANIFFICHLLLDNPDDCRGGTAEDDGYSIGRTKNCQVRATHL
jgi:hypothetical protein